MRVGEEFNPRGLWQGSWMPDWLLARSEVSPAAKLLYARLCRFADESGVAYPSEEELGEALGTTARQVRRWVGELREVELVRTERANRHRSNVFRFLWHEWMQDKLSSPDRTNCPVRQDKLSSPDRTNCPRATVHEESLSTEMAAAPPKVRDLSAQVNGYWQDFLAAYPKRSGDRGTAKGAEKFRLLLKAKTDPERIIAGARRYAAWAAATGNAGTEFVKQIPTFLNGRGWEEDWDIPADANGAQPPAPARTQEETDALIRAAVQPGMFSSRRRNAQ